MSLYQKISTKIFFASVCSCLVASTVVAPIASLFTEAAQAQSRRVRYVPPSNLDAPKVSASGITRSGCKDGQTICLIALLPDLQVQSSSAPQTISERPTIYFLTRQAESRTATFSLDEDDGLKNKRIYKKSFTIKNDAGIISFKLPDDAPILEIGKKYKLRFNVEYEGAGETVYGYIQRVLPSQKFADQIKNTTKPIDLAALYAQQGFWFETVQTLAEAQLTLPQNPEITEEWLELLKSAKLNRVLPFPLVGQIPKKQSNAKPSDTAPKPSDTIQKPSDTTLKPSDATPKPSTTLKPSDATPKPSSATPNSYN